MRQAELIDHLERVFRDAHLPLSYTRALKPRPRIKLAANLPIGIELRGEVAEAYFDDLVPIEKIQAAAEQFPDGIALRDAKEVWHGFPSARRSSVAPSTRSSCAARKTSPRMRSAARSFGS
jgi:uncharacterized protein (DUF2344 family)